ncbi:MAG: lytic transglycosylase domain-containing protein [Candidatus Binataceae bacterium]
MLAGAVVALAMTLVAAPGASAGSAQADFPRPAAIEPSVEFWVNVFSAYSDRDFIVMDRGQVSRIYQVYHLPGYGPPSRHDIEWINAYMKAKYGDILNRLATGERPATYQEQRIAELFKGEPPSAYAAAAGNLRVQEGLRERFRRGLLRAKYYLPTMERIFRNAGLPPQLVNLAQIESGFQVRARSGAGAVGIWQFTRGTGRKYLRINRYRDDRLNPVRETEAAARLLRANYDEFGDWPLAITAYNYGTGGTARAASIYAGDYCKLVRQYDGPRFGFAVKNYYPEFLAALQVYRYRGRYFPGIEDEPAIRPARVEWILHPRHHRSDHHSRLRRTSSHSHWVRIRDHRISAKVHHRHKPSGQGA